MLVNQSLTFQGNRKHGVLNPSDFPWNTPYIGFNIPLGCMKHWKALELWKDTQYLEKVAGTRTIPIEIGSRYTEEDWAQSFVTFSEFLETHIPMKCEKIGYLAQHQLFQQV